jgi:hypothetical protein
MNDLEEPFMQRAIQILTQVNQAVVNAIPDLRPLLGHRVQMIALDLEQPGQSELDQKITLDQFLVTRPEWPGDRPPISLEAMDEAITEGAIDSAHL